MPTPSSHDGNDALSFNSTCPDEPVARAPSGWLPPPPPSYEESEQQPQIEATNASSAHIASGDVTETQPLTTASQSPATMPGTEPTTDSSPPPDTESMFIRPAEQDGDDDASKHTDTDEDMADTNPAGESQEIHIPPSQHEDQTSRTDRVNRTEQPETTTDRTSERPERPERPERIERPERTEILHRASRSRRNSDRHLSGRDLVRFDITVADLWDYPLRQNTRTNRRAPAGGNSARVDPPSTGLDIGRREESGLTDDLSWFNDPAMFVGCDPTVLRVIPMPPPTFLRPGSRFVGTQQSERQVYDVQVEIKHVDLRESFLCGYLRIQGLTEDHPTLTTYFEGEIIGSKYGFTTKHKEWGANDRVDMSHWGKFAAFRQFSRQAKKGNFVIKDYLQKENIFMRWKEHFLVPDHHVEKIHGASFEGFYYICFNQVEGVVHGIYFHSKSEKFQQLELKHVEDKGCMSSLEFR